MKSSRDDAKQDHNTDNEHQKTVSGKKQHGPDDKIGQDAGGNQGSKGQNFRGDGSSGPNNASGSVGSHKPGGDGPGDEEVQTRTRPVKNAAAMM